MCSACSGDYEGADVIEDSEGNIDEDRRYWQRRIGARCACGHAKWWHAPDGKCLREFNGPCACVEFREQEDRRKEEAVA